MLVVVSYDLLYFGLWKKNDIRSGRHCVFLMHLHLVFVTKYRRKIFDQDAIEKLKSYFASVCYDFDVELVEMDGERDHVHLLINYPPKHRVSSRLLRRDWPDIASRYYYKGVLWSPSYFAASCGGTSISIIKEYIEQQDTTK
ncbi:MAG: IS200/IS605 family transposase [Candidatus Phlomobacter fragariae]